MGRPVGSKTGRRPAGGYPKVAPAIGAFFAGFVEGEASFSITRQPKGTNHRCLMSLCVRDDDESLVVELQRATALGRISRRSAYGTSRPQVIWSIGAKSDCLRLTEILDDYPLRGRKSYDYAIWRAALNFWIGDGVTVYKQNRDWTAMRYLKDRLQEQRAFKPDRELYTTLEGGPDRHLDWPGYFSGLLSADGCLAIVRNGQGFNPVVQITLRVDDRPLLEAIQRQTRVGSIYLDRSKKPTPSALWMTRDRTGLTKVVRYLRGSPPRGKRGREYRVWKEAVRIYASSAPRAAVRRELAGRRESLALIRKYAGPR